EFPGRLVIAVFVQGFASIAVKFIEPFQALLLAVTLLLFTVACLLLAVAFLLRAITRLLVSILCVLVLPGFRGSALAAVGRRRFCQARRGQQCCRNDPDCHHSACPFSDGHALFLSLVCDPVCAGAEFVCFCFSCSSLPTTRTLNKIPCASMRF